MAANSNIFKMSNAGGFKSLTRYYDMLAGNTVWNPWEPAGAYESIAAVTVPSGGVASVTFSNIPQIFAHLQVRVLARDSRSNSASNIEWRYNGDTGNNYTSHVVYGNGGSTAAAVDLNLSTQSAIRIPGASASANIFGVGILDILDYTNTNKNKVSRTLSGHDQNGDGQLYFTSGLWNNTAAITSITFVPTTANIVQHSSFALYGIKG
jgi:hypothetical protein